MSPLGKRVVVRLGVDVCGEWLAAEGQEKECIFDIAHALEAQTKT